MQKTPPCVIVDSLPGGRLSVAGRWRGHEDHASMTSPVEQAIQNKSAVVGVVGLGYVGLPLIRAFIAAGYRTMGFDVDQSKVDKLLAGQSYIGHIPSAWINDC